MAKQNSYEQPGYTPLPPIGMTPGEYGHSGELGDAILKKMKRYRGNVNKGFGPVEDSRQNAINTITSGARSINNLARKLLPKKNK